MRRPLVTCSLAALVAGGVATAAALLPMSPARADRPLAALPAPLLDVAAGPPGLQTVVFAGGCFWGVQGVFQHVRGVTQAVAGYVGGTLADPSYEQVSTGATGHAESVRVTFDPAQVSLGRLLQVFFSVALDPTEVNQQGPDSGTQYRSELFVSDPSQDRTAHAYIAQLDAAHAFDRPIATRIDPAGPFYPAEGYHQNYLTLHPDSPYIAMNDIPKVQALQRLFPDLWQAEPVLVRGAAAAGG